MSIRIEQYRALVTTRAFLYDLLTVNKFPTTRREMRQRAMTCLRHFPFLRENGEPMFSRDSIGLRQINRKEQNDRND